MAEFEKVASVSEIADGEKQLVEADDRLVILFRVRAVHGVRQIQISFVNRHLHQ